MYDIAARKAVLALVDQGRSLNSVSRQTGISRSAIREWQRRLEPRHDDHGCPRCAAPPGPPSPADRYSYLLGLYLGDGCLSRYRRDVYGLRIACADTWPGLMAECESAIRAVRPNGSVRRVPRQGCRMVTALWKHWPCLFPQHGPGRKHERLLTLESWQQGIVDAHPRELLRGLFHSDGCRVVNRVRGKLATGERVYEYPRYLFTNESQDIQRLCGQALDRVGAAWKFNNTYSISVARAEAVARLDEFIGPKY